jgi:Asp-tRNA(Asn)/Glu-tRNA(Gln) amidotransferase A subunit family amidase
MTIAGFARAFRAGEITSEAATERCLATIRERNAALNAFTLVLEERAM